MKKIMFSAVALVAFSFAGMANTGGEEKIEMKNEIINHLEILNSVDTELESGDKCFLQSVSFLEALEEAGDCEYTQEEATMIINIVYAICEGYFVVH